MAISVCIATYNGQQFIEEQLLSILSQLGENDEIIISDDGSTDNTLFIIDRLADTRIRVYNNLGRSGPIYNFENALKHAVGDYIFLSDQDDKWLPGKVEKMKQALNNIELVVSDCYIGDEDLNIIKESFFDWRSSRNGILKNIWRNSYLGCCMAFHRNLLEYALPFPKNIPMHDIWLGLIAEIYYKTIFIPDRLMVYRRHRSNTTVVTTHFKSKESIRHRIMFRTDLAFAIVKRILLLKWPVGT